MLHSSEALTDGDLLLTGALTGCNAAALYFEENIFRQPLAFSPKTTLLEITMCFRRHPASKPNDEAAVKTTDDAAKTCCICLDTFDEETSSIRLNCDHEFHTECITKWQQGSTGDTNEKCPLCRRSITLDNHNNTKIQQPCIGCNGCCGASFWKLFNWCKENGRINTKGMRFFYYFFLMVGLLILFILGLCGQLLWFIPFIGIIFGIIGGIGLFGLSPDTRFFEEDPKLYTLGLIGTWITLIVAVSCLFLSNAMLFQK